METTKIAELKAKLSSILHRVRQGTTYTVFDRNTPIAIIKPTQEEDFSPIQDGIFNKIFKEPSEVKIHKGMLTPVIDLLTQERSKR